MNEFLGFVLDRFQNSMILVLLAGAAALGLIGVVYLLHRLKYKGTKRFPWGKSMLYLLLTGYFAIVFYATLLRYSWGVRSWNLHLFRGWLEAWNQFSVKGWLNILLNVGMFVPLGVLLPLLFRRSRKWYMTVGAGFMFSLMIEVIQLISCRGIFDVDDLFANTLGTLIGYAAVMFLLSCCSKKGKRLKPAIRYCAVLLLLIGGIGSVFVVYTVQPYGNFPEAAAYRIDTGNMEWVLECALPAVQDAAPVYRAQSLTMEEADAFGKEFFEIVGGELNDIQYYDKETYFSDHSGDENGAHFLIVSYPDGSYEYSGHWRDDTEYTDTDRETVEKALAPYPVFIPKEAEFLAEGEGWHSFSVKQKVDGAVMIDGVLRCRYDTRGRFTDIDNHLLTYAYYDAEPIISAQEAYEKLQKGAFSDGVMERYEPKKVHVQDCRLVYKVDTKGFYRAVYLFDLISSDGKYFATVMIPAAE